jgi:GNAT superfamily N-acetyltransferase
MQRVVAEGMRGCGYEISPDLDEDFADLAGFYRKDGGEFLVMDLPGHGVIGTVAVGRREDGSCMLRRMYIDAPYRGRGWGRLLLRAAMDWARGAGFRRMTLETAPNMSAAMRLYASEGFRLEGASRHFGRAGISFSRDLDRETPSPVRASVREARPVHSFIGWFAVVVGVLIVLVNAYGIWDLLRLLPRGNWSYGMAAMRAVIALGGAVLAYFGLRRVRDRG